MALLVEAVLVTVAEDWLQYAEALVIEQGLASSCGSWSPDWPSSVGSHFQAAPQLLGHQACPASGWPLQKHLQIQRLGYPGLHQDVTFFVQFLQAVGSPLGAFLWLCQVKVVPLHVDLLED